jgi:hypothetical protein
LLHKNFEGDSFYYVGFALSPLQGFLNALIYARPRIQEHLRSPRKNRLQRGDNRRAANQHILPPPIQESPPNPISDNPSSTTAGSDAPSGSVHFPPPIQESPPKPITDSEVTGCIHAYPPNSITNSEKPARSVHFPPPMQESLPKPITDGEVAGCIQASPPNSSGSIHESAPMPTTDIEAGTLLVEGAANKTSTKNSNQASW